MNAEKENEVISLIYDASMNPLLWLDVVEGIVKLTDSKTAILTALDQMCPSYDFVYTSNIPEEGLVAYVDDRIRVIDMALHGQGLITKGVGNPEQYDMLHYADVPGTDEYLFYEKCLAPTGITRICGVLLEYGPARWSILGVHRAKEAPQYSREEMECVQRLGVHLRRALQIHRQISMVQQQNRKLHKMLDLIKTGIILLNEKHSLVYSNIYAQRVLEQKNLLHMDRFNRLKVPKHQQQKLSHLIDSILMSSVHPVKDIGGVLALADEDGHSLMLSVVPFTEQHDLADSELQPEEKLVAVFITEVDRAYTLAKPYLQQMFGLAKREAEICEHLVNGYALEEISDTVQITMSTVRTYIKYIYAKTGCTSQTQLMHLLMGATTNFEHIH